MIRRLGELQDEILRDPTQSEVHEETFQALTFTLLQGACFMVAVSVNFTDAKEIANDVACELYEKFKGLYPDWLHRPAARNCVAYLRSSVRNAFLDLVRSAARLPRLESIDDETAGNTVVAHEPRILGLVGAEVRVAAASVARIMSALDRLVLDDSFDDRELAAASGRTTNAIGIYRHRLRKRLRAHFEP